MHVKFRKVLILVLFISFIAFSSAYAYGLDEKVVIEGTLTGIYQHGSLEGDRDIGRGAAVLDLGMNFRPTDKDEFQIILSHAAGNGLNRLELFSLIPYADDLEADLKGINERDRDYLLEAWYKRTFTLSEGASLGITGGIIDATAYIDDNAFANDEVSQFINDVFVNSAVANLPSHDLGSAAELVIFDFSIRGLMMIQK